MPKEIVHRKGVWRTSKSGKRYRYYYVPKKRKQRKTKKSPRSLFNKIKRSIGLKLLGVK